MDLAQLVVSRRTIHNYKAESISDAMVLKALELSLWAPNHKLTFPWTYFWLGTKSRMALADLAVEMKSAKEPLSEMKRAATRESVLNPSHFILLATRIAGVEPGRQHEDFATLSCAAQIAMLYLTEQGVGTKWSTGGFTKHARTYELLGISPTEFRLEGGLMIGVPQVVPPIPARPPLEQFIQRRD